MEILVRFIAGGLTASAFAVIGNFFNSTRFAHLFGAAPSVALASLTLAASKSVMADASVESRFMVLEAVAMGVVAWISYQLLMRRGMKAPSAAAFSLGVWFVVAFLLWHVLMRG